MATLIGKTLKNRYKITKLLGHGGMAEVYLAADKLLESEVAVKVIQTENILPKVLQRGLKRFHIEARKMAQLTHPNIVPVVDYGEYDGQPFIVMRYLVGGTLKKKLGSPMPYQEAITLLLPVADALAYAHSKGLVHRDVKPSNILLTEGGQPMLSDFGVAKVLEGEETLDLTLTGMGVGTPEYMAPEQVEGKAIDARADIYALGVVLYELLTRHKPFEADTPMAVLIKHARDPLPNPGQYVKNLPNEVEQVLYKVLAKQPGERYQSMAELMTAMQDALEGTQAEPVDQRHPSVLKKETTSVASALRAQKKKQGGSSTPMWLAIGLTAAAVGIIFVISSRGRAPAAAGPEEQPGAQPMESEVSTATMPATHTHTVIPTPSLGIGSSITSDKDGMTLVYVPAGEFLMGSSESDADAFDDEKPQRSVYLDAFWIDQTEVSNAMFAKFVDQREYHTDAENEGWSWEYTGREWKKVEGADWQHPRGPASSMVGIEDHPVVHVSWRDAQAYCAWAGRRLPTEAEWEKAARGTQGNKFPWGNTFYGNRLNYCDQNCERDAYTDSIWDDGYSDRAPVGSYPEGASPYGALDMAGNVWEWVADWYDESYYRRAPSINPPGPASGEAHVFRGGSWYYPEGTVRVAVRIGIYPNWYGDCGFRCARDASP